MRKKKKKKKGDIVQLKMQSMHWNWGGDVVGGTGNVGTLQNDCFMHEFGNLLCSRLFQPLWSKQLICLCKVA